ncbi:MAG: hypothetical protein CMN30_17190 [Sandaracinus sp.]|nr:hypothetical protein [Sandaracinus sp.]|tara:strand:- start:560 stop:1021 length:462 start_codon:yes stop_codon:yes gene_type:complete
MSLHALLERGIRGALAEQEGQLEAYVAERELEPETVVHLRQALEALPGLLVALDGAIYSPEVPVHARDTFSQVVRYLLLEDDLVPSRDDRVLVGMLDDVYLLHRAAQELRAHIAGVDFRSIDGGAALLAHVLPSEVVTLLDDHLAAVVGVSES